MKLLIVFIMILLSVKSMSQSYMVKSIYFKPGSYEIQGKYKDTFAFIAYRCQSDSFAGIKYYGYSDTTGAEDYNFNLSKLRIEAVEKYLSQFIHLDSTKIQHAILGESDDDYDLHFPQAHLMQRCVDIRIRFKKATLKNK